MAGICEATRTFTDSSTSTAFAACCVCAAQLDFHNRPSFRLLQSIMIVRRLADFAAINLAATKVAVSRTLSLHLGMTTCGRFVVGFPVWHDERCTMFNDSTSCSSHHLLFFSTGTVKHPRFANFDVVALVRPVVAPPNRLSMERSAT